MNPLILVNPSPKSIFIKRTDRIAQMLIQKVKEAEFILVDTLDSTLRGQDGFGSTGA